jgi:hypothetical protein
MYKHILKGDVELNCQFWLPVHMQGIGCLLQEPRGGENIPPVHAIQQLTSAHITPTA